MPYESKSELKRLCTLNPMEMADRMYRQEALLRELRDALSPTYSLSPEGRAYLEKIDRALTEK